MYTTIIHRVCLSVLALAGAFVGIWAYFAPLNWYQNFPGMGMKLLPVLGPFDEHFVKDVGAMYLALAALSVLTIVYITNKTLVMVAGVSWSIFNLLHLSTT